MARVEKKSTSNKKGNPSRPHPVKNPFDKLDETDFKIMWHLDFEARKSLTDLGEELGMSKQLLKYRITKLEDQGFLKNAYAIVDIHSLGLVTFRVYYRFTGVSGKIEEEIIKTFSESENTLWVVSTEGNWDMEVVFVARNQIHFNQIFKELHYKISRYVRRFNISSSPVSYQLRRDYLVREVRPKFFASFYGFEPSSKQRDDIDYAILTELCSNCQQTNEEVAKKVGISSPAIAKRIKDLEEDNIIRVYRQSVNLAALGRKYVKALLYLGNLSHKIEKDIYEFCSKRSFVAYLTEVVGDWQLEVETEVLDEQEIVTLMKELTAAFPENVLDYQILRIGAEHKLNYMPTGRVTRKVLNNA